eukprot:scaffold310450_cov29-Prasinocladus_malaysianus.AAC.1
MAHTTERILFGEVTERPIVYFYLAGRTECSRQDGSSSRSGSSSFVRSCQLRQAEALSVRRKTVALEARGAATFRTTMDLVLGRD